MVPIKHRHKFAPQVNNVWVLGHAEEMLMLAIKVFYLYLYLLNIK